MDYHHWLNKPEYLAICVKCEYFKRNSIQKAHENIKKLMEQDEAEFLPAKSPRKRMRNSLDELSNMVKRGPRVARLPNDSNDKTMEDRIPKEQNSQKSDTDSDGSEIERKRTEKPMDFSAFKLKEINEIYKELADSEVSQMLIKANNRRQDLSGEHILHLLSLQSMSHDLHLDNILPHIDKLNVTIAYRGIIFNFYNSKLKKWTTTSYWKHTRGCMCWYNNHVFLGEGEKYQNRAALDFHFLIKHPNAKFEELKFKIEKYQSWNPKKLPYHKFFVKMKNAMKEPLSKVHVKNWSMEYFYTKDENYGEEPMIVMAIWSFLKVGVLESIRIRKWNDDHWEKKPDTVKKWRNMWNWEKLPKLKCLDTDDSVEMNPSNEISMTLRTNLTMEQFESLMKKFTKTPPASYTIYTGPEFSFKDAIENLEFDQYLKLSNSYYCRDGLVVRFDPTSQVKRIIFSRR